MWTVYKIYYRNLSKNYYYYGWLFCFDYLWKNKVYFSHFTTNWSFRWRCHRCWWGWDHQFFGQHWRLTWGCPTPKWWWLFCLECCYIGTCSREWRKILPGRYRRLNCSIEWPTWHNCYCTFHQRSTIDISRWKIQKLSSNLASTKKDFQPFSSCKKAGFCHFRRLWILLLVIFCLFWPKSNFRASKRAKIAILRFVKVLNFDFDDYLHFLRAQIWPKSKLRAWRNCKNKDWNAGQKMILNRIPELPEGQECLRCLLGIW